MKLMGESKGALIKEPYGALAAFYKLRRSHNSSSPAVRGTDWRPLEGRAAAAMARGGLTPGPTLARWVGQQRWASPHHQVGTLEVFGAFHTF